MSKIRIGFVGAGWMGCCLMKRLTERDDVEIKALYEINEEKGRQALTDLNLSPDLLVGDYGDIVRNPDIDAVFLVSPNSFHAGQSIEALKAGKHVFCEKPCATNFDEYCEQIRLEKANPNLVTFVDYLLNFDTMEIRLQDMAHAGEFGTITQIQVNYRHPINITGDKTWKLKTDLMGDAIGMGIVHSLSGMYNIMSAQAKPVGVYATSMPARVRGFEADPVWNILVRFDDGATGFCFGNIDFVNGYDAYHNILGTDGAFMFSSYADRPQKVHYWTRQGTDGKWVYPLDPERCAADGHPDYAWPAETTTPDSGDVMDHQTAECVGHFIESVKKGEQSFLSFANSAPVADMGWAARMSAATGKEVALPLDYEAAREFFKK